MRSDLDDFPQQGGDAGAKLRRARPRARWSLGDKERRAKQAVEMALKPSQRSAHTIAMEQLAHVREMVEEQSEPLVIDLQKLERSADPEAAMLREFTNDIVRRRRNAPMRDVVFLRGEDLGMLAGLLGCAVEDVTPTLERMRILAD
jgi:hypothetical protein